MILYFSKFSFLKVFKIYLFSELTAWKSNLWRVSFYIYFETLNSQGPFYPKVRLRSVEIRLRSVLKIRLGSVPFKVRPV